MKCMAIMRAFYNGSIINPGQTFDIEKCPNWAKPVEQTVLTEKNLSKTPEDVDFKPNDENIPFGISNSAETQDNPVDDLDTKTPEELNTILDDLINEGIQANILLDGVEDKTPVEQIRELRNLLGYKGE